MNFIQQLKQKNKSLESRIAAIDQEVTNLMAYYTSSKFQGVGNDFAHVSTDVMKRLTELRNLVQSECSEDDIEADFDFYSNLYKEENGIRPRGLTHAELAAWFNQNFKTVKGAIIKRV